MNKDRKYNINVFALENLREKVPSLSKTILKRKLYALINKRDKLEKKPKVLPVFNWSIQGGHPNINIKTELDHVKEAILIIADEIAHREFAKMCPVDTDTNTIGNK